MLSDGEVIYGDHLLGLGKEQFLRKSVEEKGQGASWRDLENANVVARMSELVYHEPLSEDSSVAEFCRS